MSERSSQFDQSFPNEVTSQLSRLDRAQLDGGTYSETPGSMGEEPVTEEPTTVDERRPARQRFVFTDPVAFRYLEEDASTSVLERHGRLEGYELYLVEQWACSRVHPTFVITTYTGDPSHSVSVGVLSVPTDEDAWSSRLKVYFKAVSQYHARRKDTALGVLMVTNLSGFPSALTVIAIPDGDIKKHREDFIVNEDLKRLGCSGRAGLTLSVPSGATQAKFLQLYRTSDRVPLYSAVLELVKLCQVALVMFSLLGAEYADGLLCDVTERAINDWWTQVGTEFYNLEPSDGILGPTTAAALLGMVIGARNRLNACGAPVGKDAFDINSLKRGVAYFQKSQKLPKTRRLDRQTLERLHRVTAKAASGEGWMVPKAVKSTVAELSGKGGEMVMGMVGARDKAGIGEIETLDIDRFIQLVHGERSKWLWYGKPRKSLGDETAARTAKDESLVFEQSNQGGYVWSGKKRDSLDLQDSKSDNRPKETFAESVSRPTFHSTNTAELLRERELRTGQKHRKHESRSGFGRIKDAVGISGRKGHHRHSRDDDISDGDEKILHDHDRDGVRPAISPNKAELSPGPSMTSNEVPPDSGPLRTKMDEMRREREAEVSDTSTTDLRQRPGSAVGSRVSLLSEDAGENIEDAPQAAAEQEPTRSTRASLDEPLRPVDSSNVSNKLAKKYLEPKAEYHGFSSQKFIPYLRRTQSFSRYISDRSEANTDEVWPRSLSFSVAEEAIFDWDELGDLSKEEADDSDVAKALTKELFLAETAKDYYEHLVRLEEKVHPWVQAELTSVENLDTCAVQDEEKLNELYYQHLDDHQVLRDYARNLLTGERTTLTEAIRELEVFGAKLEYELNALSTKVQDVEDGVAEFERQVADAEARADELDLEETHESYFHWAFRLLTGLGKDPALEIRST